MEITTLIYSYMEQLYDQEGIEKRQLLIHLQPTNELRNFRMGPVIIQNYGKNYY